MCYDTATQVLYVGTVPWLLAGSASVGTVPCNGLVTCQGLYLFGVVTVPGIARGRHCPGIVTIGEGDLCYTG